MSVNRYRPHVWIVPEDDANRQLANGFLLHPRLDLTSVDIRPVSGGWHRLLDSVVEQYAAELRKYEHRQLVLLFDFDGQGDQRARRFRDRIPEGLRERVYLLGMRDEPETVKAALGYSFETMGQRLADACCQQEDGLWDNEHLRHNKPELDRLFVSVRPILFP